MLDLKYIRANSDKVRAMLHQRRADVDLDELLDWDRKWRQLQTELEAAKQAHNHASQRIARLKKQGQAAESLIQETQHQSEQVRLLAEQAREARAQVDQHQLCIPNLLHPETPIGQFPTDNVVVRHWGQPPTFDFQPRPHWEIAEQLELVDMERAAKVSGNRFVCFRGLGALLERALINFMLDLHTRQHGYVEIAPPLLVNRSSMTGTGQIPRMEQDMYRCEADDLFLIPTAEVPLTNLLTDEMLSASDLPIAYTAATPCFRREAGTYGRETRGIIRVHQFDKVELVRFVVPETACEEHSRLLEHAEEILRQLGLHYRVVELCSADLSFAAMRCYDLEVWSPGQNAYLEVSSCSYFGDFQARRANIRFRRHRKARPEFVHTLNASGLALPRTIVALLENYQLRDGRVSIPKVLRPYMNGLIYLDT